jgi:uncharacterized protein YjbJ (UPF0337 family)
MGAVLAKARARVHAGSATATIPPARRCLPEDEFPSDQMRESTMDKNRIDGAGKEIKGAAKEALGKVTGNVGKQAEGAAEKTIGKVQRKAGEAADHARKT